MSDNPITMGALPQRVALTKGEAAALRKLNDKTAAIQKFIQTITQTGEARLAELQAEGRSVWEGIRVAHDLDLESVNYDLDLDGESLVPTGMKL